MAFQFQPRLVGKSRKRLQWGAAARMGKVSSSQNDKPTVRLDELIAARRAEMREEDAQRSSADG